MALLFYWIRNVNYTEISGKIIDGSADESAVYVGLGGVRVSAQTYDADNSEIIEKAATYTDSEEILGYYRLPIESNQSYNIVVFSKAYTHKCACLAAENGKNYIQDFDLALSDNNQVFLDNNFENSNPDPFPDIKVSFIYLDADCGDEELNKKNQVESIIVAVYETNDSAYEHNDVYLPYGNYKFIVSVPTTR